MYEFSQALDDLRKGIGLHAVFRPGQWEAIDAVVNQKKRLLVVQRTGWGKSAVYFLTCKALRKMSGQIGLIVSPLLALMRNQLEAASRFGLEAMKIDSSDKTSFEKVLYALKTDQIDCLFVTPERFANDDFRRKVLTPYMHRVGLLVIDEAHCISDWGHDFRPDYRRLQLIVEQVPRNTAILATTATANDRVIEDIRKQLGNIMVSRGTLERKSLRLDAFVMPSKNARWVWVDNALRQLEGTGLIYTQTIRETYMLAQWLTYRGHSAAAYSSDLESEERLLLEDKLQSNEIKVLVTTSSLGMGYDKPDLKFVIHLEAPTSIIAYYQQVGRAGRAVDVAYGILLHHPDDESVLRYFWKSAFPSSKLMKEVVRAIEEAPVGVSLSYLEKKINAKRSRIQAALTHLSILVPSPVVHQKDGWYATGYPYRRNQDYIDGIYKMREREWEQMLEYIHTSECKMDFLRRALNDSCSTKCGHCGSCVGDHILDVSIPEEEVVDLEHYLKERCIQVKLPQKIPGDALFGMNIRGSLPKRKAIVLSRWMDEGWGTLVAEGKHGGYFDDALVDASVNVLRRYPDYEAPIDAVCCITSLRHPQLVPDFAARLARHLGVTFINAVRKVQDTPQQKTLENSYYQVKNLDRAFVIDESAVRGKSILLVDDALDSGWTLAVVCQQLIIAGARSVCPFALTLTQNHS